MSLPTTPGDDVPTPQRGRWARIMGIFLWVSALGFVIGAVQLGLALRSGQSWANFRGEVITSAEMRNTLVLFVVAAGVCTLLALRWQRFLRRGS